MLPLHGRMGADEHVALGDSLAVDLQAVPDRRSDGIGDEDRHPSGRNCDELAARSRQPYRIVLVLVNIRAEGGARHVRVDLIGDRDDSVADDFERDRVASRFVQSMRVSWSGPMQNVSPGRMIVVEPYSSSTAGPVPRKPGASA